MLVFFFGFSFPKFVEIANAKRTHFDCQSNMSVYCILKPYIYTILNLKYEYGKSVLFSFSFVVLIVVFLLVFVHGIWMLTHLICVKCVTISADSPSHPDEMFIWKYGIHSWLTKRTQRRKHTTIMKKIILEKKERTPSAFHFVNRIISTEISMWKQHNNWGHWNFVRTQRERDRVRERERDIQNTSESLANFKRFWTKFLFHRK